MQHEEDSCPADAVYLHMRMPLYPTTAHGPCRAGWAALLGCLLCIGQCLAQLPHIDVARFYTLEGDPYVELYVGIETTQLVRRPVQGGYQGLAAVQVQLYSLPDSTRLFETREHLKTETLADSTQLPSLIQFQLRRALPPGNYGLTVSCQDAQANGTKARVYEARRFFYLTPQADSLTVSDLMLLQGYQPSDTQLTSFSKNGWELYPLATDGVLMGQDSLYFYWEYYRLDRKIQEPYYLAYYLRPAGSSEAPGQARTLTRPSLPRAYTSYVGGLPLAGLADGLYELHLELNTNTGRLLARQTRALAIYKEAETETQADLSAYDRLYGYKDEELRELIPQLQPISSRLEVDFARALRTEEERKNYFVSFWQKRARAGEAGEKEPAALALDYRKRLAYANQHFGLPGRAGWQTDRGRILLQYGAPNTLEQVDSDERSHPYQLWNYNTLDGQSAVSFVFADLGLTGNYQLIHSSHRREVQNTAWRQMIQQNGNGAAGGSPDTSPNQPILEPGR
jgi:GWxTD domain-containing protein